MISPTYVNQTLLTNLLNNENPYVIMTSPILDQNKIDVTETHSKSFFNKEETSTQSTSQARRHTHNSVFRRHSKINHNIQSLEDGLNDPLYETMSFYVKNDNCEEENYVTTNEFSQQFHKKLTKVHERRPTKMKIQRPVSVTLPASSYYDQKQGNLIHDNTICDQWLQVLQQQSHDVKDCCLQHIHRTSRRRSANILRETRSSELNQHSKICENNNTVDKNNNDLLDDIKIVAYTTLQKEKLFTKERKRSCNELHDVCFGPLLL